MTGQEEAVERFTDVNQVLTRISSLNSDFQRVEEISAALDACLQQCMAIRDGLSKQLSQVIEAAEAKAILLDAHIASATATEDSVKNTGATILADHERKWMETNQQIQHLSEQISARMSDIQNANQIWRQQLEASNMSWQATEERLTARWRAEVSQDVSAGIEEMASQARIATAKAQEQAEAIARLSRSQVESDQQIRHEMATDRTTWLDYMQKQKLENVALGNSVALLRKLLYGAGGAIVILLILCLIALLR